ncbi:MAG: hemerythrin domain-containing protein [Polyangiales bacterium]
MNAVAVAVPKIPREDWTAHPRFRSQALLLGSHANFRRVSSFLVDRAASEKFVGLHSLFDRWIAAMRSHEAYEERKLYPYLEYRWQVSLDEARTGHSELHARADEVAEAFRSLARPADPADSAADPPDNTVLRALQAHDHTLGDHLDVEEEAVIPLLLALDPEEFHRYYRSPLSMLIPADRP